MTPEDMRKCIVPPEYWDRVKPPKEMLLKIQQLLEEGRPAAPAYHPDHGWFILAEPPLEQESN